MYLQKRNLQLSTQNRLKATLIIITATSTPPAAEEGTGVRSGDRAGSENEHLESRGHIDPSHPDGRAANGRLGQLSAVKAPRHLIGSSSRTTLGR